MAWNGRSTILGNFASSISVLITTLWIWYFISTLYISTSKPHLRVCCWGLPNLKYCTLRKRLRWVGFFLSYPSEQCSKIGLAEIGILRLTGNRISPRALNQPINQDWITLALMMWPFPFCRLPPRSPLHCLAYRFSPPLHHWPKPQGRSYPNPFSSQTPIKSCFTMTLWKKS